MAHCRDIDRLFVKPLLEPLESITEKA